MNTKYQNQDFTVPQSLLFFKQIVIMLLIAFLFILNTKQCAVSAAEIIINSDELTISGDSDDDPQTFNGAPFSAGKNGGIAKFIINGDLNINSDDVVRGVGENAISLVVSGDVNIPEGAVFDISADPTTPGPGGGSGGASAAGGQGGIGGPVGTVVGFGGDGGAGRKGWKYSGVAEDGKEGWLSSEEERPGNNGDPGLPGFFGIDGFNAPESGANPIQIVNNGGLGKAGSGGQFIGGKGGIGAYFEQTGFGSSARYKLIDGGVGGSATFNYAGVDYGHGGAGTTGATGNGGKNTGKGAEISGGGGGSGGQAGGGGAGGASGRNGKGGGGGGGGMGENDWFNSDDRGGKGGKGGDGGLGGAGGKGGSGGAGGAGGPGGGAIEIVSYSRMNVSASFLARGGSGSAGAEGQQGEDLGSNGGPGNDGSSPGKPENDAYPGGKGGRGADGLRGGSGGAGGTGGGGGGGAGGSVKLFASILNASGGSVDISGGSGAGGASSGESGRLIFGSNISNSPGMTATSNDRMENYDGAQAINTHLADKAMTPYIPALVGGSGISGRLNGFNAGSFPEIVANAPAGSRVAILRLEVGPTGYDEKFEGFNFLVFINLTCEEVTHPLMGLGAVDYLAPLQENTITMDPLFGGAGPKHLQSLKPYEVYATLVPTELVHVNVSFSTPGDFFSQSVEQLDLDAPFYVGDSVATNCPKPGDIPAPDFVPDPDPIQPPEPNLSAMNFTFQGGIVVNIDGPNNAVWKAGETGSTVPSGVEAEGLNVGAVDIQFGSVPGWLPPRNQTIEILPDYDQAIYPPIDDLAEASRDMLDVEYQRAPTFKIGSIAPKKIYEGDSLGFYVEPAATMIVEGDQPEGGIVFTNSWFSYQPDPADRLPFLVRFTSVADPQVSQAIQIQPIPDQRSEQEIIKLRSPTPPNPSGREYVVVHTAEEGENRVITISGKDIVFSANSTEGNGDSGLIDLVNGREDVKALNLYGDKVVIRESLKLHGTQVTIYARELHFEDHSEQVEAQIDVTPKDNGNGDGLPSGNIRLLVGKVISGSSSSPRFVLRGGAAAKGTGGQGGLLEAPFSELEPFAEFTGGSGSPNRGPAGQFQLLQDGEVPLSYQWLHPLAARAVLVYAKDLYFMGYRDDAEALLTHYDRLLGVMKNFTLVTDLPHADNALLQFEEIRQDMNSVLDRLEGHLDYFGNPAGWVPMLSFEVNYKLTDQEIERAMKFLYLSYWLGKKGNDLEQAQEAMGMAKETMETEITELSEEYEKLMEPGGPIESLDQEIEVIVGTIERLGTDLEKIDAELEAEAERNVELRNKVPFWKKLVRVGAKIAKAVPIYQPTLGAVGSGLDQVTRLDEQSPLDTIKQGHDIYKEYNKAKEAKKKKDKELSEAMKKAGKKADDDEKEGTDYVKIMQETHSVYKKVEDDIKGLTKETEIPQNKIEAELKTLREESSMFAGISDELKKLNEQKLAFSSNLSALKNRTDEIRTVVAKNLLAIHSVQKAIDENNQTLDPEALNFIKEIEQRSKNRLRKYLYWLAKSYEYRLLEPYDQYLDLVGLFDKIRDLAEVGKKPDSDEVDPDQFEQHELTEDNFQVLKRIFSESLAELTQTIFERINNNGPELTFTKNESPAEEKPSFGLTELQLKELNETGSFVLNLVEDNVFGPDIEGVRIVSLNVKSMKTHFEGADPELLASASLDLKFTHSGLSKLMRDGETYLFNHYRSDDVNPIVWRSLYNAFAPDAKILTTQPTAASNSLLATLLAMNGDANERLLKYSRPSAWADIHVKSQFNPVWHEGVVPSPIKLVIDEVTLEVDYDFFNKPDNRSDIEIVVNDDLKPNILVNEVDRNGRQDGTGSMVRSYHRNVGPVSLTAESRFGAWTFDSWINQNGQILSEMEILNLTKESHQRVFATYVKGLDPLVPIGDEPEPVCLNLADCDEDGLADAWEQQIIDADPNDEITSIEDVNPTDDFDGDNSTNLDEFQKGSNPIVPDKNTVPVEPYGPEYEVIAFDFDTCLDASGVNTATTHTACHDGSSQLWRIEVVGDEFFQISSIESQNCLTVPEVGIPEGTSVAQAAFTGEDTQLWSVERNGDLYDIVSAHNGHCLTAMALDAAGSGGVLEAPCEPSADPQWALFPKNLEMVYEDAEDDSTAVWEVFDNDPAGATITSVFDDVRQSKVIQFAGAGLNNGYWLRNADGTSWRNFSHTIISWDMQFSEAFVVFVDIETTEGHRFLQYEPVNTDVSVIGDVNGDRIRHGLGNDIINGEWHTITRDLQGDLHAAQPDVDILEVNGFLILGSGRIDNIILKFDGPQGTLYEDAEDGLAAGWHVFDNDPAGAVFTNVFDDTRQSQVIQLSGAGIENGYWLRNADNTLWQNSDQFTISWDMQFSEAFVVFVDVETSAGHRFLRYEPLDTEVIVDGDRIHHGLGSDIIDGQWRTITRDLQADLNAAQPDVDVLEVNGFLILGSGRIDNIQLQ